MSLKREKMSNVDIAWWHMEKPVNLIMITTIMVYEGRPDYERMIRTLAVRLLAFDRFRQRVVDPPVPWRASRWELDPTFDHRAHIRRVALPEPGDQAALEALVSDLMSTPLDYTKPLWQIHIVENFGDDHVVISRFHHCIADGIALMRLLLSLTDDEPSGETHMEAPPASGSRRPRASGGLLNAVTGPVRGVVMGATQLVDTAVKAGEASLRLSLEALQDPDKVVDSAKTAADFVARFGRMTLRLPDPPTIFKGDLSSQKRVAWSRPAPLGEVKKAANAMGGKINDLMVTAISGALRLYMEDQGIETAGMNFRAYIPVNLRPDAQEIALGNAFGLVFLSLPVGIVDRRERFRVVQMRMGELKSSQEAAVSIAVLGIAGLLPKQIEGTAFRLYHAKATAVLTNVPGPDHQLYFAGSPLRYMIGWVPQSGSLGLGISIISYNGEIMVGVNTDAGLVPDPGQIIASYEEELKAVLGTAVS